MSVLVGGWVVGVGVGVCVCGVRGTGTVTQWVDGGWVMGGGCTVYQWARLVDRNKSGQCCIRRRGIDVQLQYSVVQ